ncbi:hypothetical protein [Franzmannia qiaohouensis]|uniref:Uncharacterized protein n=1 Tax=Franzmannia qiaohouensis TaxID=1329370 RepID=A0ABU1HJ15_9GAMM|nr:hypothetical protein [Halomonas qiaohouensis]MDR5907028.1 hypothetical protein [Halomonas qiaohouensis]
MIGFTAIIGLVGRPNQIFASADFDGSDWVIRIAGKAVVVGTGMLKSAPGKSDNSR